MLIIDCPYCGQRPEIEFSYGGQAHLVRPVNPAELSDIERYFVAADAPAKERVALYRLAWDVACSAFGGRQVLYERFFFGDPVRMASALVDNTDLKPLSERVRAFLKRPD